MKLVIDIPEEEYELVRHADEFPMEVLRNLLNAIIKGTPLPKGHGRLNDADAVLEEPIGNTYKDIDIAETIIEAEGSDLE